MQNDQFSSVFLDLIIFSNFGICTCIFNAIRRQTLYETISRFWKSCPWLCKLKSCRRHSVLFRSSPALIDNSVVRIPLDGLALITYTCTLDLRVNMPIQTYQYSVIVLIEMCTSNFSCIYRRPEMAGGRCTIRQKRLPKDVRVHGLSIPLLWYWTWCWYIIMNKQLDQLKNIKLIAVKMKN